MDNNEHIDRREFIGLAALAVAGAVLPRMSEGAAPRNPGVNKVLQNGTTVDREVVSWKALPFPGKQVRLLDGIFRRETDINRTYLHMLPNDRLAHMFRLTAGLSSSAEPLGGWEKPDCELRGHFAGGHYLSAAALTYASAGDYDLKRKADELVAIFAKCQQAHGNGYLSAFPEEFFDRLREGKPVWAPFYTLHKIMAGHLDMYTLAGNEQALETLKGMADWVARWVDPLSETHMQRVLEVEHGGMLEVLCNLYAMTGNARYLQIARRFDHRAIFDPLADYRDELTGLHVNTNIPKIIGAARQYELTGDVRYRDIADYFWQEVTARRTFCSGGTSYREHWLGTPGNLTKDIGQDMEECCCGYNMLKLTRHIFGWTADPRAMDYYERALFNSRLGTQDPHGLKSYFLPLGRGWWKYYNSPFDSFWCCTGTGIEEFSKFNNSIYFHDQDGIYVNLFIASEVNWPQKAIRLRQETQFPEQEVTTLVISAERPAEMTLNIRIPCWATQGGGVKLNGRPLAAFSSPGSYLALHRTWTSGDQVEVSLPMSLHLDPLPGDGSQQAVMYGPLVLAGRLGNSRLGKSSTYLGYQTSPGGKPVAAPEVQAGKGAQASWVEPVRGKALTFGTAGQAQSTELVPLYKVHDERYVVYWKVNSSASSQCGT
ncbi:MAG: hypothetical protein EPN47_03695 [Acidobacteria bacterium]|nr:MAG: hypothetical protein EPN47_03695 [Acidobacteriota bacterium]